MQWRRLTIFLCADETFGLTPPTTGGSMASQPEAAKNVLWNGSWFGRLSKSGKNYLLQKGWVHLGDQTSQNPCLCDELLQFVWPSKSGAQFDMSRKLPAKVRPLPTQVTDVLDDKIKLAHLLEGSGIAPECIYSPDEAKEGELYFVKHRFGAQGKSVYAYDKKELENWWRRAGNKNASDFCIQKEVLPALDNEGRKFVLRSHLLLVLQQQSNIKEAQGEPLLSAYLHDDVICLAHASKYDSNLKSAHVSQAGKHHPDPVLLHQLESSHPASRAYGKIKRSSQALVRLSREPLTTGQQPLAGGVKFFALLGNDFLVSSETLEVKLCEVNSHPALGWGTMSGVSRSVFQRLIQDTLDILLFLENHEKTGFELLSPDAVFPTK